jgi:ribosomal protein S18 acetylase RimI-like enzyme
VEVSLVPFAIVHGDEVVAMWRASFESAVGVSEPHTSEQQRDYLLCTVVPNNRVLVAMARDRVVGFVAASAERVEQLYVHPDYQRIGIGSRLLQWAKDQSPGHLSLFTFERNERAQKFYEARGFRVVGRGFEKLWQLPDIRYEWRDDLDY